MLEKKVLDYEKSRRILFFYSNIYFYLRDIVLLVKEAAGSLAQPSSRWLLVVFGPNSIPKSLSYCRYHRVKGDSEWQECNGFLHFSVEDYAEIDDVETFFHIFVIISCFLLKE